MFVSTAVSATFSKVQNLEKVFSPHVERDGVFLQNDFEFGGAAREGKAWTEKVDCLLFNYR
jgi:hypothetical protein